jgi:predicted RNase H-like HicB family nuclease
MKEYLQHTIKAFIKRGEKYFVAECHEIPVVTQGKTLDEAVANLKEAVALHVDTHGQARGTFSQNKLRLT